jgi:Integrase core domain
LFLAVVIDLFSRNVVGWSMRPDMHCSLVIDALEMGVYQRRPQPGGLIFHSDRGTQYASEDFRAVIEKHGMRNHKVNKISDCYSAHPLQSLLNLLLFHPVNLKNPNIRTRKLPMFGSGEMAQVHFGSTVWTEKAAPR